MNSIKALKQGPRIGSHYAIFSLLLSLLLLIGATTLVLASDVSNAIWHGDIIITNNGTATTAVSTNMSLNSEALIEGGYASADLSDIAVQINGVDTAFMPGHNASSPWMIFVPTIGAAQNLSYDLYPGNVTGGKLRYFPGSGGMTTTDNPSLEPSANFTIEQKGWVDTDNGSDKNLVYKEDVFRTYISGTGNITSAILSWQSPTGFTDPDTLWNNETQGYDENTGTSASRAVNTVTWSSYLHFDRGLITASEVRIWADVAGTTTEEINIQINSGGWINIYTGAFNDLAWVEYDFGGIYPITDLRIRLYNDAGGTQNVHIYEVDFREHLANVFATGISSGEHTVTTNTDNSSLFLGIGVDIVDADFPITDNLTLNAPLWHTETDNATFTTKDVNEHSCAVSGATWTSDGYSFDGNDEITQATFLDTMPGEVTFIAWAYWSGGTGSSECIISKSNVNNQDRIFLYKMPDEHLQLRTEGANDGNKDAKSVATINQDTWYHCAGVYSANATIKVYLQTIETTGAEAGKIEDGTHEDFYIGSQWGGSFITGIIGEVRVYDRALTSAEILADYNTTKWKYETSDEYFHYSLVGSGIPNNSNDWAYYENMGAYWEYTDISVNGTQVQYIDWEYGATFNDTSGYGNDATPTFRTTSSDADVSASLSEFGPVEEAQLGTFTITSEYDILTGNATMPSEMYSELDVTRIPGGEAANIMLAEGEVPQAAWWFPFLYLGICIIGMTVYSATTLGRTGIGDGLREGKIDGSLFIMFVVMEVPIAILGIMDVTPYWPAILFPLPAVAIILSRKHYSWG